MWDISEGLIRMSLIGSYCILLILPARLLLSGFGRKYAFCLWVAVFLNLVIPFEIRGRFSLIPEPVGSLSVEAQTTQAEGIFVYTGEAEYAAASNPAQEQQPGFERTVLQPAAKVDFYNPSASAQTGRIWNIAMLWQRLPDILRVVWLPGFFVILLYNLAYAARTGKKLSRDRWKSWDGEKRIAEVEGLPAPFLWGIFRPVIFLPTGLEEEEKNCIIAHESCHRHRKDSLTKLAFFAAVSIHWFNPLVWLSWALFCRDMEICCDEAVFAVSGGTSRKQYAQSLLKYAAAQNGYRVSSLTFGEPSAGMRIRHILRFQKRHIVLRSAAGLAAAVMILGLVVRPAAAKNMTKPGLLLNAGENEIQDTGAELPEDTASEAGDTEPVRVWEPEHRMGYQRTEVTHVVREDNPYFTPGLRPEQELEMLARTALRELYDLTGYQVESCVYECSDLGTFFFARTLEDLSHSRLFYTRAFGEAQGYDALVIPSMDCAGARRVWFSDVQQLALPEHAEQMSDQELAVWFLEHSAVYQGEEIGHTESLPESWTQRVYTTDGTYYEVTLEGSFIGVSSIYGPYPEGFSH